MLLSYATDPEPHSVPFSAYVHFDDHGRLALSFCANNRPALLSLGPFRTVCRLEEAVTRLLGSASLGASFAFDATGAQRFLWASGQRWRLPVLHLDDAMPLCQWASELPTIWLDDQRPPMRRRFDLTGPIARLMP